MFRYLALLSFFAVPVLSFAATGDTVTPIVCENIYEIRGPSQIRMGTTQEYSVSTGSGDFYGSVTYMLKRDGKVVETVENREKYLRYFSNPGEVLLEAKIVTNFDECSYVVSKKIQVYESILLYVGSQRSGIETPIQDVYEKNNILFKSYLKGSNVSQSENAQEMWESIAQSDIFIVGNGDVLGFFSDIVKLQKIKPINFAKKKIYVISGFSKSFLSKVLASSFSQMGAAKVFLISEDQFYTIITRLSSRENNDMSIGQELSYEKGKTIYSLSRFIEFLAYAGFSYQLLAFLLSITFVVLVLNFLKQVVGFNVFGIYYPVLLAITLVSLGISGAAIFMLIGFISIVIVNFFSKKVHLLLHAKRALLISLYILLFLFFLGIDNVFELSLISYTIFDNPFIIFPFFIAIILADKIFQEDVKIFGRSGIIDFLQYATITLVIFLLFEYNALQYLLISYPDIIILVVFLNILVGRYMGLQIFEYFRFSPLLKKLDEEE